MRHQTPQRIYLQAFLPNTFRCNGPELEKSYCGVSTPSQESHLLLLHDGAETIAWRCSDRRSLFQLPLL